MTYLEQLQAHTPFHNNKAIGNTINKVYVLKLFLCLYNYLCHPEIQLISFPPFRIDVEFC